MALPLSSSPSSLSPLSSSQFRIGPLAAAVLLAIAGIGLAASPGAAQAQAAVPASRDYDLPAAPLASTLNRIAREAGIALTVDAALLAGYNAEAVLGRYEAPEALRRALGGTGLELRRTDAGGYTVRRAPPTPTSAPTADAALVAETLVAVTVVAAADKSALPAPYAGGQVARGSQLGLLGNTDFMNAPFNISSYTAQTIEDQQSATVASVLLNDPSVRFTTSEGHIYENFNIRGFDINGEDLAFNGLYGLSPYGHAPTEFLERVEVLKGPGALLGGMSPQGAVGGVINLVPKRAGDAPLTRLTGEFTSRSQYGAHIDLGRRFGDDNRFGIRVNGAYRDGKVGVDGQSKERVLGAVALDYRGDRLKVSLDAYSDQENVDNGSAWMASFAGPVIKPPKAGANLLRGIHGRLKNDAVLLRGEYEISDRLSAYAAVGSLRYRYEGYINGTRASVRNAAGDFMGETAHQRGGVDTVSAEAGLRGSFETGPVKHQVVLSATSLDFDSYRANPVWSKLYASNIYNPATPLLGADPGPAPRTGKATLSSVALADTLSFAQDKVLLTLGARDQRVRTNAFNAKTGRKTSAYDQSAVTPMLGLVVKPWAAPVSLYANYIEGLSQGDTVTDLKAANYGEVFAPYKTKQVEAGVKWDADGFGNTLSLFQITRPSLVKDAASNTYSDQGEQRNRGVEWNVFGAISPEWRVLGGVAYTQGRVKRGASAGVDGKTPYGLPKWKANLGVEWQVPAVPGLVLNARMVYTGTQFVNFANTQRIPGWTRFDLGARYVLRAMGKDVVLRGNVENVADKSYWAGSFNDGFVTQGGPRTFKVSASVDF